MKPKPIVTGVILVLVGALGIYALLKAHRAGGADADDDQEESGPTVVSVQVGTLKRETLHRYLSGYGTVIPAPATANAPAADAALAAPTTGVVATVDVVEGQSVAKGDLMMTLNSATATSEYARNELDRQKRLYEQHNASLKSLQDAETQLALLRITSPLSGTVTRVSVKPGSAVDPTTVVAEVIDLNRLVVSTAVPAGDAAALAQGQAVEVEGRQPLVAALTYVSPTVNQADGTVQARAALPTGAGLRPGDFVPVRIVTAVEKDCLVAPEASVVSDVDGHSVLAIVHGDQAEQTPVQTGLREAGWVQVSAPELKAGDTVVTVGAYGLPEKTRIKVAPPPGGPPPAEAGPATPAQ